MVRKGEAAAWAEEADAKQAYKGALSGGGVGWLSAGKAVPVTFQASPDLPVTLFTSGDTLFSSVFSCGHLDSFSQDTLYFKMHYSSLVNYHSYPSPEKPLTSGQQIYIGSQWPMKFKQ